VRRYEALLTVRQQELLILCEERIVTVPLLFEEFGWMNPEFDMPPLTKVSIYQSLTTLERRGLVMRNPGTWPVEWAATEEGREALELSEHDVLTPSR
jgi:DNA-binding HxlR family transcriptional regulator